MPLQLLTPDSATSPAPVPPPTRAAVSGAGAANGHVPAFVIGGDEVAICEYDIWIVAPAAAQEMQDKHVVSRQRVIDHGEVYTPSKLVNDMLDLVAHECERIDSRFLEPACGNGNFLAEVLRRKLRTVNKTHPRNQPRWERDAILSLCSLYGIDLLPDNVADCRTRLLQIVEEVHASQFKQPLSEPVRKVASYVLSTNIVHGDALTLKTADGSPIVFPEWSAINGMMIKRRDYTFHDLLGHGENRSLPLFSDLGHDVYLPKSVADYPACHFLKIADAGDVQP